MLAQTAARAAQGDERERERDNWHCYRFGRLRGWYVACLPPSLPLNWGSEALMVVDPSGSNHHLAVAEQAGRQADGGRGISSHQSWPSKQAN